MAKQNGTKLNGESKISQEVLTFSKGIQKNLKKESFYDYMGIFRRLLDPILTINQDIDHIEMSAALYNSLLAYANNYSEMVFTRINRFAGINVVVNDSFVSGQFEIHYKERIQQEWIPVSQ